MKLTVFLPLSVVCAVSAFGQETSFPKTQVGQSIGPASLFKLTIQLQLNSIENYAWYASQRGSKQKGKDQLDAKTEVEQYYGDSGTVSLRGKAQAVVDGSEFSWAGAVDIGATSFMKAINVKSRGAEKFYELIVPEAADLNYLGGDQELKKKCFPHLKPVSTLWRATSKQVTNRVSVKGNSIGPRNADVLFPESKNSNFTTIRALGDMETNANLTFNFEGLRFEMTLSPSSVFCEAYTTLSGIAGAAGKYLRCSIASPFELSLLVDESYDSSQGIPMGSVMQLAGMGQLLLGGNLNGGVLHRVHDWRQRPDLFTAWLGDLVQRGVGFNNALVVRPVVAAAAGGPPGEVGAYSSSIPIKPARRTFAQAGPAACLPESK